MNPNTDKREAISELLILADGRILVHNLTPEFASLLRELNPAAEQISPRAACLTQRATPNTPSHELSD